MDYLTLSSDVRYYFGIQAAHILLNDNDIMVMLRQINEKSIIFDCPEIDININDCYLVKFNSNFGQIELNINITSFYSNEYIFTCEAQITGINRNDFLIALNNFLLRLIEEKKRKEERILCNQKNLKKLHLINHFFIQQNNNKYNCIIKDISLSGIKVFTNIELLNCKDIKSNITLNFIEPNEKIHFENCEILRKSEYIFNDFKLCEMVFKIEPCLEYTSRINYFFQDNQKKHKR